MHISQLPAQTICLHYHDRFGVLHLMTTLHESSGVKAGPLMDAIRIFSPRVIERWLVVKRQRQDTYEPGSWDWACEEAYQVSEPTVSVNSGALPEGQTSLIHNGACGIGGDVTRDFSSMGFDNYDYSKTASIWDVRDEDVVHFGELDL